MSRITSGELTPDNRHLNQRLPLDTLHSEYLDTNATEGGLDLSQVVNAIQRQIRIVLAIGILTIGATVYWNRTRPPVYQGSFKILIEPVTVEEQVVSAVTGNQQSGGEQDSSGAQSSKTTLDYPTQIQLLLSEKILLPVAQKLKPSHPELSYEILKTSLTIARFKATEDTKILEVKYVTNSPSKTKHVLNLVSSAYIQYSLSERKTNVRRAIKFVDNQLPKIQAQVNTLETQLQTFREKYQLTDPKILASQLNNQTSITEQDRLKTQIDLNKAQQLYRSIEQQFQLQPKSAEAASVLSDAPGYQQLVKQLQDIDVELESLSADLTEEHPKIISLREKKKKFAPTSAGKS